MPDEIRDSQNPSMSPEKQFEEAIAAARAMKSQEFGSGENAVFAGRGQSIADKKKTKREEMLEKLTELVANRVAEQIGQRIEMLMQPKMSTKVDNASKQESPAGSQPPIQPMASSVPQESRKSIDSIAWPPSPQNAPAGTPGAFPEVGIREANEAEIRPPELRGLGDRLPDAPYGIGRDTKPASLDDAPIKVQEGSSVSFVPPDRPIGGPQLAASRPTPDVGVSPPQHRQQLPVPSLTLEPQGYPNVDVQGGQVAQRSEMMRDYAEANMQLHDAMSMFLGMLLGSINNLTEQLYQTSTALDRQEFSE